MDDMYDEYEKHFEEANKAAAERQSSILRQVQQHLGPHSSTADQSFISRLAEMRQPRPTSPEVVAITSDNRPQPPPGGGAIRTRIRSKSTPYDKTGIKPVYTAPNEQPPQPPPSSGAASAKTRVRKKTKPPNRPLVIHVADTSKIDGKPIAVEVDVKKPPQDLPPGGGAIAAPKLLTPDRIQTATASSTRKTPLTRSGFSC